MPQVHGGRVVEWASEVRARVLLDDLSGQPVDVLDVHPAQQVVTAEAAETVAEVGGEVGVERGEQDGAGPSERQLLDKVAPGGGWPSLVRRPRQRLPVIYGSPR
ncbi:hypothetical protein N566_18295 [Streptomycetaceae bacterium MP113-05]|nr:hypothetical protein N566_18295 [Streptomycetaceae bacterium MP113-05]